LNDQITIGIRKRIEQLCQWVFPNLKQARFATIAGTTPFYSLSLYMDGSVVHAFDVRQAIVSYLFSCWQCRSPDHKRADAFAETFRSILEQEAPIKDEKIAEWLGPQELYGDNINAWDRRIADHENAWSKYIDGLQGKISDTDKKQLRSHRIASCLLTSKHVAAALRYMNYMRHTGKIAKPQIVNE